MSFGWSVSDIAICAQKAYKIYKIFKEAPGACADFVQGMLWFHRILVRTSITLQELESKDHFKEDISVRKLMESDKEILKILVADCRDFLTTVVCGSKPAKPGSECYCLTCVLARGDGEFMVDVVCLNEREQVPSRAGRKVDEWIQKVQFSRKIPKLQEKISGFVEKLTSFNIQIIHSYHLNQRRLNSSYVKKLASIEGVTEDILSSQVRMENSQSRVEESQTRLELQLQQILANQQRRGTPLLSKSLNASSPEGRQTWMEIGRLLRDEGITPETIQKNKRKLITAMKQALAESVAESFHTAREAFSVGSSSAIKPLSEAISFGTAPPSVSGFPDSFLNTYQGTSGSLDQKENVSTGVKSLILGMEKSILVPRVAMRSDGDDASNEIMHEIE